MDNQYIPGAFPINSNLNNTFQNPVSSRHINHNSEPHEVINMQQRNLMPSPGRQEISTTNNLNSYQSMPSNSNDTIQIDGRTSDYTFLDSTQNDQSENDTTQIFASKPYYNPGYPPHLQALQGQQQWQSPLRQQLPPQNQQYQQYGRHMEPRVHAVNFGNYYNNQNMLPAPLFQFKTKKTIKLTKDGNFVVAIPIASRVLPEKNSKQGREFSTLKYAAVVGDPDEFVGRKYSLRAKEIGRVTELFIVITMYNEDEELFSRTWNSDGREKIQKKTLSYLGILGCYQDGVIKTSVTGQPVSAHVFEYTTQIGLDKDHNIKKEAQIPVQVIFCLKEKNAKKINSHRWFFNAFGAVLNPNVCILIDVGTKPTEPSLFNLWSTFNKNPYCGGACGEIFTETGHCGVKLLNPLVAAQNFEYKMSNILDKPLESCFGFISVLPGAFSAYRYAALQDGPLEKYFAGEKMNGDVNIATANMYLAEDRILCFELVTKKNQKWILRYVKGASAETDVPDSIDEFISQRRRWLNGSFFAGVYSLSCFYQIFRSNHSFGRKAALLIQSFYNFINLLFNWFAVANIYLIFYFLTANLTIGATAYLGPNSIFSFGPTVGIVLTILFNQVYFVAMFLIFLASLGNRPQGSKVIYGICFFLFSFIMTIMLFLSAWTIYLEVPKSQTEWNNIYGKLSEPYFFGLLISIFSTYGVYLLSSLIYGEPYHMFTSFVQYLLFLPSFTNILMVYAFCNLHGAFFFDVSWGTKGSTTENIDLAPVEVVQTDRGVIQATTDLPVNQNDIDNKFSDFLEQLKTKVDIKKKSIDPKTLQEDYFRLFRTRVVLFYVFTNTLLILVMITPYISNNFGITSVTDDRNLYMTFILWSIAALSIVRFIGSVTYLMH
ncbi:Chitin synthase, class 1 [Clydaea vesicula]|uniref:Chitin synthase n=1 Tax=Clydaea vesicula TaxID=447962 RepID=A0AAD5XTP0_9FUNG|nr:Chitin synthase, class 1 [Clydaea vesicula]